MEQKMEQKHVIFALKEIGKVILYTGKNGNLSGAVQSSAPDDLPLQGILRVYDVGSSQIKAAFFFYISDTEVQCSSPGKITCTLSFKVLARDLDPMQLLVVPYLEERQLFSGKVYTLPKTVAIKDYDIEVVSSLSAL